MFIYILHNVSTYCSTYVRHSDQIIPSLNSNYVKFFIFNCNILDRGGDRVVSVLAFYSDGRSSKPGGVPQILLVEKNENKHKEAVMARFLKNVPYWSFPGLDFDGWKRLQDTDGMLCRGNRDCSWIDNSLVCQRMHLEIEPNVIWIFYCGHLACFSSKLGDLRLMLPVKLFIDTGYIACRLGGWVLNCC